MKTYHKLIIGNCESMEGVKDGSIHLIVTSPPYYNAPFDYNGYYRDYDKYLEIMNNVVSEMYRVLENGRILFINIDDMLVDGVKYPITADFTKILQNIGFRYRDRIIWKKPDGYLRISRRSGVLLQNPYPMYYYPDNLLESILIFQKGEYRHNCKSIDLKKASGIDLDEFKVNKWYSTLWEITNVLPGSELEKGIAAFPEELPKRAISLFTFRGENVLDPFMGSGTTMKVAREMGRNCIGIEINPNLEEIIRKKCKLPIAGDVNNENLYFKLERRV